MDGAVGWHRSIHFQLWIDISMELKQVIIARKDLKMSPGKLAAQVAHASVTAVLSEMEHDQDAAEWKLPLVSDVLTWWKGSQVKIVLKVDSEGDLISVYNAAVLSDLPCSIIKDEGRTELDGQNYTTCAIGPASPEEVNSITQDLKLYR